MNPPLADSAAALPWHRRVNAHVLANVLAWLADPLDASSVRALRGTCTLAVRAFDVAVHAGWIALSMHDSAADDDEGATYRWVRGWVPCDTSTCVTSKRAAAFTVRLEHRLVNVEVGPFWPASGVAVCETLQPSEGTVGLLTPIACACGAEVVEWRIAKTTTTVYDQLWYAASFFNVCHFDTSGLGSITAIGHAFLAECPRLASIDTRGLGAVTTIGDSFLTECVSLLSFDSTPLIGVTAIHDWFLSSCTSLTTFDPVGLRSVTSVGNGFVARCTSLSALDTTGLRSVTAIGNDFLFGCTSLTKFDTVGLRAVTSIQDQFLAGCSSLTSFDSSGLVAVARVGLWLLDDCPLLEDLQVSASASPCAKDVLHGLGLVH